MSREHPAALSGQLTRGQVQLTALVAEGLTDMAIARKLGISVNTVETEIRRARQRVNASNRTHLAVIALREGWID